jgi:anti-sigma regulatory factor (Ser/Thr protein kinase)
VGEATKIEIPRDEGCARRARHAVGDYLQGRVTAERRDAAQLVASELVTNAYRHGEGRIELRLALRGAQLVIEVIDQGRGEAVKVRREAKAGGGGRGLRIVDHLATEWGVFEGTTHVWAKLPLE